MKKTKVLYKIIASVMCIIFMYGNVYAKDISLPENTVLDLSVKGEEQLCRWVFDHEKHDISQGLIWRFKVKSGEKVTFLPLDIIATAASYVEPASSSYTYPQYKTDDANSYVTIEQKDAYSNSNAYFTVWFNSKKIRVNGRDYQLKYEPVFEGTYNNLNGVWLSTDDVSALYGYDINYWGEKNTYYFKRNGKGYLQTYAASANTTASSSSSSYATYPTSRHIPDFTAVTGIQGQKDPSRINYYTYYNVSKASRDKYFSALQAAGFTQIGFNSQTEPMSGLVLAKAGYVYGNPPQSELLIGYTVEENGVLTIAFNPEYY